MKSETSQTASRTVACLFVVACLMAGCGRSSTDYVFEAQPRMPLAAAGFESTRSPQIVVSPAGMISLLTLYQDGSNTRVGFNRRRQTAREKIAIIGLFRLLG